MIKITVGFIVGIMVASAMAQSNLPIKDAVGTIHIVAMTAPTPRGTVKLSAHLDEDELKAIKEACK